MQIIDQAIRDQALEPTQSFLVEAPAGSGKTSLLTLRFLKLLCTVEHNPEEVLCITFTNKAAEEMRNRILTALQHAQEQTPTSAYQQQLYQAAKQVLIIDQQRQWNLLNNPKRLKIQTIDALCASIVRKMPILSKFGANANVTDDPQYIYQYAVHNLLKDTRAENIQYLLEYLDNKQELLKKLLANLLPNREQWISYIFDIDSLANIEHGLQIIVEEHLEQLMQHLPENISHIEELALIAANNLSIELPELSELKKWQFIRELILTKDGGIRKTLSSKQGFLAPSSTKDKAEKQHREQCKKIFLECIAKLGANFINKLDMVKILPPTSLNQQQSKILTALINVLPKLAGYLTLSFIELGCVDFNEVTIQAINALGKLDEPSDLSLKYDYLIKHILVDEFQDTSQLQYQLLELLTAGWQANETRTIFLVGDPQQSIYRFRQAEVSLFLKAKHQGLGQIKLKYLQLQTNFRSCKNIVNWVNNSFNNIFPAQENMNLGAIPASQANACHDFSGKVSLYNLSDNCKITEAEQIAKLILAQWQASRQCTIAILVRSRSHLSEITITLKKYAIPFQGIDIEPLATHPLVQDALSLTKCLLFPEDELSKVAILRSPLFGLSLNDLYYLQNQLVDNISIEGKCIVERFTQTQHKTKQLLHSIPIAELAYLTWKQLGGENIIQTTHEAEIITKFFNFLEQHQHHQELYKIGFLEDKLSSLYADHESITCQAVQIMTMHKAKGLEFDLVFLPGLGRKPNQDPEQLLLFDERTSNHDENYLLLAPIKSAENHEDPIYQYIKQTNKQRQQFESARLLYVACTRAKRNLYLLGHMNDAKVAKNSMWEMIINAGTKYHHLEIEKTRLSENLTNHVVRQPYNIVLSPTLPTFATSSAPVIKYIEQDWMREAGITMHRIFWIIAQSFVIPDLLVLKQKWQQILKFQGISGEDLTKADHVISLAVNNTLNSKIGQWIFNKQHQQASNEWPLSFYNKFTSSIENVILDRFFIDYQSKDAWIIDYKLCLDDELEQNLQQYHQQLQKYKWVVSNLSQYKYSKMNIRSGLWFAKQCHWIDV